MFFGAKKGSPARGLAWEAIIDHLKEIHSPKFQMKDKKAVRERWSLPRRKFSKKISEEVGFGEWDFCGRVYGEGSTGRGVIRERRYHASKD